MSKMKTAAERYTSELSVALGDRLRSVVLHGSVARGEAVEGVSDVNLLVLVDAVDAALLRDLAPHARRWLKAERALPLVLTWDEWAAAADVFAIETTDMLDAREVLHGPDPLSDTVVDDRHLRIQAERELRGKLIHLREGTLATADQPAELGRLVLSALPSVATYLRAALRLAGESVAGATTPAVLTRGAALLGIDDAPLLELWDVRGRGKPPKMAVDDPRAAAVHDVLERTAHHVDTLSREKP
jgi:predicted nucleotidyltransferase